MPSDYGAISAHNEQMLGKDRASRMSQVSMYADTAHFVFEILQNADDAGATEVVFKVSNDQLVIEHNGKPFTSDDVKAISYFGKGKTDKTKIGHFGLGFKSVFAYTASPRIHSGQESFEITELYALRAVPIPSDLERNRTRFVLPFDHEARRPAYIEAERLKRGPVASKEIAAKLAHVGPETLLFTRSLAEIRWEGAGRPGHYVRDETPLSGGGRQLFIVTADGDESCFLVFEEPVDTSGNEHPPAGRLVQIAFRLTKRLEDRGSIEPVRGAKLFVFFQTDKETHTGLIFQGPYLTTPARDNVPEQDDFNRQLVKQSAELLVKSVQRLKSLKLLTLDALSTLPLDLERFAEGSFFHPVHIAVRNALQDLPLLPTSTGGFVSARQAKIARGADLVKVFNPKQLQALFEIEGVRWLDPNLTSTKHPGLYQMLIGKRRQQPGYFQRADWASKPLADGMEVSPSDIAPSLTAHFLEAQSDEWLMQFMAYVQESSNSAYIDIPIVRLESGKHVTPFDEDSQPNAYLPTEDGSVELHGLPMVRASLLTNSQVLEFLQDDLCLGPPDLADIFIKKILPKYQKPQRDVKVAAWRRHFQMLVSALDSYNTLELRKAVAHTKILIGVRPSNKCELRHVTPSELYLSSPEVDDYVAVSQGLYVTPPDVYEEHAHEALVTMGVARTPRVRRRSTDPHGHVTIRSCHGYHRRGRDGFDPSWTIEGLDSALKKPSAVRSQLIWKTLLEHSDRIRGEVESSTRQTFQDSTREEVVSDTGKLLMATAWLPDGRGGFVKPCDIELDELPVEFTEASAGARALAECLGMRKSEEQEAMNVLTRGNQKKRHLLEWVHTADEDQLQRITKSFEKIMEVTPMPRESPPFKSFKEGIRSLRRVSIGEPGEERGGPAPASNPDRYRKESEKAALEALEAGRKRRRSVTFSLTPCSASNKAARKFLEEEYRGCCQVTSHTFKKRTGGNYFVALSLVGRLDAEHLNNAGNMLCLCAEMAAQFMHSDFEWSDDIEEKIVNFKAEKEGGTKEMRTVCAKVGGKSVAVTWSERHFMRLCALWKCA